MTRFHDTDLGDVLFTPKEEAAADIVDADHVADMQATDILDRVITPLKDEMYRVLADGFQWKKDATDNWFTVSIDEEMQGFLTRTLLKLNDGRVNPHSGFIHSKGVSVAIDDVGMRELCVFASMWGDSISAIRIQTLDLIIDWQNFDPFAIDWSVNWTGADALNGWNDNTVVQTL